MDPLRGMMHQDAFRELETMSDRLNRLLSGRSMPTMGRDESIAVPQWAPAVDVLETDAEFQIRVELPGLQKQDVKLSVEDSVLLVSGSREQEKEEQGKRYHRIERAYGRFARSFQLPDAVDEQKLSADFHHGILTVHLPKSEKAKPKSIDIKVA